MLTGRAYQYQWGSKRELSDTWRYMKDTYGDIFTGEVYASQHMRGVKWDKSVAPGVWMFEVKNETK